MNDNKDSININMMPEIVMANNECISAHLSGVNEKLANFKLNLIEEEESEYDNFYNRINIYFSNMVSEMKLVYFSVSKQFLEKEAKLNDTIRSLSNKIQELEEKIAFYQNKLNECKSDHQLLEKNIRGLEVKLRESESNNQDLIKLIVENVVLQIELDNEKRRTLNNTEEVVEKNRLITSPSNFYNDYKYNRNNRYPHPLLTESSNILNTNFTNASNQMIITPGKKYFRVISKKAKENIKSKSFSALDGYLNNCGEGRSRNLTPNINRKILMTNQNLSKSKERSFNFIKNIKNLSSPSLKINNTVSHTGLTNLKHNNNKIVSLKAVSNKYKKSLVSLTKTKNTLVSFDIDNRNRLHKDNSNLNIKSHK